MLVQIETKLHIVLNHNLRPKHIQSQLPSGFGGCTIIGADNLLQRTVGPNIKNTSLLSFSTLGHFFTHMQRSHTIFCKVANIALETCYKK